MYNYAINNKGFIMYTLNNYHHNIEPSELIIDLQNVAKKLGKKYISRSQYEKNGNFSATPFIRHFGNWKNALKEAGLNTEYYKEDLKRISNSDLISDIINVQKHVSKEIIYTSDYKKYGSYKVQTILNRFGNWNNALKKAGLAPTNYRIIEDVDLFKEIERLWQIKGSQPTTTDIKGGMSKYSLNTFCRRFGGWRNALNAFIEHIESFNDSEDHINSSKITDKIEFNKKNTINKKVCNDKYKHNTPRDINYRLRFKVLQRDHFSCCACGASPAKDVSVQLHVDHIIPWSKGGETIIENLQTLCSNCNLGKGNIL